MKKITEEMGIHKEWYEKAKNIKPEELTDFIKSLSNDYEHDYGTIVHAITAGALATARAINRTEQGGITGFQAGFVMWGFIRHWNFEHNKTGLKIIDYDNLLYPQYAEKFDKTISKKTWELVQKTAQQRLDEAELNKMGHPDVKEHWKSIIAGNLPFGFKISEE